MKFLILTFLIFLALAAQSAAQRRPVTIFLAGDSTMAAKRAEKRPETGWGEMFGQYFREGKVKIDNRAMNGRSTRTFIAENRWQAIVESLAPGDYVFIQFGHNDSSKDKVDRYTPPADYRANLIRFVEESRAKKATPVLLTPVVRRRFDKEGRFYGTHGEYPDIVRSIAREYRVPLIDMHRASEKLIVGLGVDGSKKLFLILKKGESPNYPDGLDDNTHFSPAGADEMAKLAVAAIRGQKIDLRKYLKNERE